MFSIRLMNRLKKCCHIAKYLLSKVEYDNTIKLFLMKNEIQTKTKKN
ncbi:MAG: hypothetical protein BAJALOKI2v1_70030 [Promethearchaeota archaeon]|nr:MAG: hypothetical protein BAJALOKI2v1_70030 [Candidatus Lokiarchaeota archaeon]